MKLTTVALLFFALAILPLEAIDLCSPADGETVCLTTPGRRAFLRMGHDERRAAFTNLTWRKWAAKEVRSKPAPVVLRWKGSVPADGFRVTVTRTGQMTPWFDERVTNCEATVWTDDDRKVYDYHQQKRVLFAQKEIDGIKR